MAWLLSVPTTCKACRKKYAQKIACAAKLKSCGPSASSASPARSLEFTVFDEGFAHVTV